MSTRSDATDPDAVMGERRRLINVAYRMLGSLAEAEDVVQEAYARWYAQSAEQRQAIEVPGAWLTTVASRICLNLLGSARVRREGYIGEWVPGPAPDPQLRDGTFVGTATRTVGLSQPGSACATRSPRSQVSRGRSHAAFGAHANRTSARSGSWMRTILPSSSGR